MTINKQALRERYSPQPVPKCHICGAEMTVQRISSSRITYGCTGATYGDAGCHYAEGRSIADYHYEQSRVIVVDVSDPDVVAMLDELEAKDKRIEEGICRANREHHRGFMMACNYMKEHANIHYADAAEMEIAALRQRINELEAREVTLPPKEHDNGTDSQIDINAGFANRMWQKCYDAIRSAGIGVKGD